MKTKHIQFDDKPVSQISLKLFHNGKGCKNFVLATSIQKGLDDFDLKWEFDKRLREFASTLYPYAYYRCTNYLDLAVERLTENGMVIEYYENN